MKRRIRRTWRRKTAALAAAFMAMSFGGITHAMPQDGTIRSGEGNITRPDDKTMTIDQKTDRLAIDWKGFDVQNGERVNFNQPDARAIALNRVTGDAKSVIDGQLTANGRVYVINPNGVLFGRNASVDVGSLVASTANVSDDTMKNFAGSKDPLTLTLGDNSTAQVINEGTIKAQGGLVALHAASVENDGTIANEGGKVALAAAKNITLSEDTAGKINFTVDGALAKASTLNSGVLRADGGYVVMTAKQAGDVMSTVVNNTGTIEAKTLRQNEKGEILLDGGNNGVVEVSGTIDASGLENNQSAGSIKVIGNTTTVHDGTNLLARGTIDGGKIETSGDVLNLGSNLNIDAKGINGSRGEWLLDPLDVIIADEDPTRTVNYSGAEKKTASDSDFTTYTDSNGSKTGNASIGYNDPTATSSNSKDSFNAVTWIPTNIVEKMLNEGTDVTIQAAANNGSANIIVKNDIEKTKGDEATFTLDAMRNITINGNITSSSDKLNVVLNADNNGDATGAVIVNANIKTNGGSFTSATGGTVTYAGTSTAGYGNGTLSGKGDLSGHTVGTYFGHVDSNGTADGEKDDRLIKTDGGKITLNGEIAIGLNGGTLTLDSGGGAVTTTGIINSGNSYGAYVYGTDTWDNLVEETVESYLKSGTVPAYHYQGVNYVKDTNDNYVKNADGTYEYTTEAQEYAAGQPHYTFSEADTQNVRWLGDGSSTSVSVDKGKGYASVVITKGSMTLEQWLNYQLTYNTANFANRYISQDSGVKIVSETVGNKTNTYVRNADGSNVTAAQFKTYLSTALANLQSNTASTDTTKMLNGETVYNNLKDDISHLLATNWFASKELAQGDTKGGSAVGDSYLATITTILENSLTTPNGQQILWAGGRGSGVLNKTGSTNNDKVYPYSYYGMPDDPTYQDGMYWVTGPEGEANNGKGTQFYSNANSNWKTGNYGETVYGYVNWDKYTEGTKTRSQPDNSSPFLTVGYGTTGKWDDAAMGGDTTVGFVKETNLANSSLNIKAGSGVVNLGGDVGKTKALDTVNIESTGAVTTGTTSADVTKYHHGTIYADHGVYISGGTVSVGGEIHSGTTSATASVSDITTRTDGYQNKAFQLDNVTLVSAGDLTVHGVEADGYKGTDGTLNGGKISLTSTGDSGKITLGKGVDYNGDTTAGTLAAASTAKGAVVVDAQGNAGAFINNTTGTSGITTGDGGTWQVYVASPFDNQTALGNLNSGTNAQWSSESTSKYSTNIAGNPIWAYTNNDTNKFIFQVTPTITISGEDFSKTYGDELSDNDLRGHLSASAVTASFVDSIGTSHDVDDYTNNFKEADDKADYIASVSDHAKTGLQNIVVSSDAQLATATRMGGYKKDDTDTADNKAIYLFSVSTKANDKTVAEGLNGYALRTKAADITINRKTLIINTDITQVYGDSTITGKTSSDYKNQLVGNDTLSPDDITYQIATDGAYATSKGSDTTAHVKEGGYADEYLTTGASVKDADGKDASVNYTINGKGTITVTPAELNITIGDTSTTYGSDQWTQYSYTRSKLVNGDEDNASTILGDNFIQYSNEAALAGTDGKLTKDANDISNPYVLSGTKTKDLTDYTVNITNGKSVVNKATLHLDTAGNKRTYGDVKNVVSDIDNATTFHDEAEIVNGDKVDDIWAVLQVKNNSSALSYDRTRTGDVGDHLITVTYQPLQNYEVITTTGTETIIKAPLQITTPPIDTVYGTVKEGSSTLSGLTNGDTADNLHYMYGTDGNYGGGYLDNNTRTNNVTEEGKPYEFGTTVSGEDFLKNYEITGGDSTLTIRPKDVYVRVDGKGNTTQDITYVDPDIDSKLSYGDHATWTPNLGGQTGEFTYDVITDINGHPFKPGESDVIGNYRFHYDGVAVVSPSKPDIDPPVVPPVVPGNGGYTLPTNPQTPSEKESGTVEKDWGTRDEGPGVDRERHIIKVQLPFFKIDDGKMTNYGTYDVKSQAAKVDISPTGKRLPEPNQPKTQYREYTKDITTSDGTGEFRLIYNGSTFHVMPLDAAARTMMQTGDEKHNVDLFAQALHIGFSEMGIIPADLDGVYANFQDIAADAQNNSK